MNKHAPVLPEPPSIEERGGDAAIDWLLENLPIKHDYLSDNPDVTHHLRYPTRWYASLLRVAGEELGYCAGDTAMILAYDMDNQVQAARVTTTGWIAGQLARKLAAATTAGNATPELTAFITEFLAEQLGTTEQAHDFLMSAYEQINRGNVE